MNPGNVLDGTDWSLPSMNSYLQFMDELKMPPKNRALRLFENAAKLFTLDIAASPTGFGALLRGI